MLVCLNRYDPLSQEDDIHSDVELDDVDSMHAGLLRDQRSTTETVRSTRQARMKRRVRGNREGRSGSLNRAEHGHLLDSTRQMTASMSEEGGRYVTCQVLAWTWSVMAPAGISFRPGLLIALAAL